jgi:hypothetical protein
LTDLVQSHSALQRIISPPPVQRKSNRFSPDRYGSSEKEQSRDCYAHARFWLGLLKNYFQGFEAQD